MLRWSTWCLERSAGRSDSFLSRGVRLGLEKLLRVHGTLASLPGCGHRLTIDPIGDIARREDGLTRRVRAGFRDDDVPIGIEVQPVAEELRVRGVADRDEDAVGRGTLACRR